MNQLASALHASDYDHNEIATNCFGGTIDIEELLSLFSHNGLAIDPAYGESALAVCANLERSKCTQEEFLNVMKEYCSVHRQIGSVASHAAGAVPIAGAAFGLILALVKVSNAIKDRASAARNKIAAAEMRARYLRGLATADNLSVEATSIAVVMHEIIARGLDDFETVQLNASSAATVQLLREDLLPYLKSLNGRSPEAVKVAELRGKRWELKQRMIRQFEIVNVHLNRVEQGLAEMRSGVPTYYMKTNRLIAYARECLLEIHLRAWYAMMGYFDPENTQIEVDDKMVQQAAGEKIGNIQSIFERYTEVRLDLLKCKYETKKEMKSIAKHEHAIYISDHGADGDMFVPRLSITQLMLQTHIRCEDPEGGGIDHMPDGSCEIWNDTMFSKQDRCSAMGRFVHEKVVSYVRGQLPIDGPVWNTNLGFVNRIRRAVQPVLPLRPNTLRYTVTAPARLPVLTSPVQVPERIPFVQPWYHEPTPSHMPTSFHGHLSETDISSIRHSD